GPTIEDSSSTRGLDPNWILSDGKDSGSSIWNADSPASATDQDRIGDWGTANSEEQSFDPLRRSLDGWDFASGLENSNSGEGDVAGANSSGAGTGALGSDFTAAAAASLFGSGT